MGALGISLAVCHDNPFMVWYMGHVCRDRCARGYFRPYTIRYLKSSKDGPADWVTPPAPYGVFSEEIGNRVSPEVGRTPANDGGTRL